MSDSGSTLGSANVKITADTSQVGPAVDAVKEKVKGIGKESEDVRVKTHEMWMGFIADGNDAANAALDAEKAADELGDASEKAGQRGGKAFGGALNDLKAVERQAFAVAAAIVSIAHASEAINEYLKTVAGMGTTGAIEADKFLEGVQSQKPESRIDAERKKLKDLNDELDGVRRSWLNFDNPVGIQITGRNLGVIKGEIKTIQDAQTTAGFEVIKNKNTADIAAQMERDRLDSVSLAKTAKATQELEDERLKTRLENARILAESQADFIKWQEEQLRMEQRIAETRIKGILDAEKALDRLHDAQSRGFTSADGSSSLQGSIEAMTNEVRALGNRMGGI